LEDVLHLLSQVQDCFFVFGFEDFADFFAFEVDFAARWRVKVEYGSCGGGFSTSTFANQPKGFAFVHREADVIHSMDDSNLFLEKNASAGEWEMLDEVFDF
jgi:hypothetical protein